MEFLSLQSTLDVVCVIGFICTLVAVLCAVFGPLASSDEDRGVRLALVGGVAAISFIVAGFVITGNIRDDERALRVSAINDRYGWTPTNDALRALAYPFAEPEAGIRDLYGHTETTIDDRAVTVQLGWDGEKMLLLDVSDNQELALAE